MYVSIKMRTTIITILLLIISLIATSQEIKLRVSVDQKCSDKDYAEFCLVKDSNVIIDYTILTESQVFELADTGIYYFYQFFDENPYYMIHITKTGIYDVKINPKVVYLSTWISNPPFSEYLCCEKPCDGLITDYYPNGQIRIKGTFKKGQPKDTITEYYLNGNLKARDYFPRLSFIKSVFEKYNKEGYLELKYQYLMLGGFYEEHFDSKGVIISRLKYKKNISETIFYQDGLPAKKILEGKDRTEFEYIDNRWIKTGT